MLQKMGFKQGSSLGAQEDGIKNPISIGKATGSRSGLGSGVKFIPPVNVKETSAGDFRARTQNIQKLRVIGRDLEKGRRIVESLDLDAGKERSVMWPREESVEGEEVEDVFLVGKGEECLLEVDTYLRNEYFYCMYW